MFAVGLSYIAFIMLRYVADSCQCVAKPIQYCKVKNIYKKIIKRKKKKRIDWSDLLAVPGTLKSLLQHHSLKASILRLSAFFMVQLSHLYMNTGKIIGLIIQAFVGKLMFLFLNTPFMFVAAFLPRSKCINGLNGANTF